MADQAVLEKLREEIPVIKNLGPESCIEEVSSRPQYTLYRVVTADRSHGYLTAVERHTDQADSVNRPVLHRFAIASMLFSQMVPGFCANVLEECLPLVLLEDMPGNQENLQLQIYHQGHVDQNVVCNLASHLAALHASATGDRLTELSQRLGPQVPNDHSIDQVFSRPYSSQSLSDCGESLAGAIQKVRMNQDLRTSVSQIRENFQTTRECLLHGDVSTGSVWVNPETGGVKMTDVGLAVPGPRAYDVGSLVADYICGYYYHMLTEKDNDSHRRVSYSLQEAITKTVDKYVETLSFGQQERAHFLQQLAGFTGVHLIKRAVYPDSRVQLSPSVRQSMLGAGSRLLSKRSKIDLVGRLLLIGLQLC